jgi:DNA-binding phage protein
MSYGYSQRVVEANKSASKSLLGVALGRVCISKDVPVTEVASTIGVSRETIYNWFSGLYEPHPSLHLAVREYISYLTKRK